MLYLCQYFERLIVQTAEILAIWFPSKHEHEVLYNTPKKSTFIISTMCTQQEPMVKAVEVKTQKDCRK